MIQEHWYTLYQFFSSYSMHAQSRDSQSAVTRTAPPPTARLILASASPRRRELLSLLGADFTIIPTDAEERAEPVPPEVRAALPACPLALHDHPSLRAWRKVADVSGSHPDAVVLGADTVVSYAGAALNKPDGADHAHAMLEQLAGNTHTVYTGLCLYDGNTQGVTFDLAASEVTLAPLSAAEIAAYVATGEPLDKAGSYGIQGLGGALVQQVVGSYTAVVGLPLPATWTLLTQAGITALNDPAETYYTWLRNQQKELLPCPPTLP
jgi:septum formation protein